jgi:trk system potassium uptake protein TrkH
VGPTLGHVHAHTPASTFANVIAVVGLACRFGFYFPAWVQAGLDLLILALALFFAFETLRELYRSSPRLEYFQLNWIRCGGLAGVALLETILFVSIVWRGNPAVIETFQFSSTVGPFAAAVQLYVILVLFEKVATSTLSMKAFARRPALTMAGSFVVLIAVGTALLMLPKATVSGISPLDALFTSTSAVSVTGLVTLPIGSTFTTTGQVFLLILIQLGGLGLVTFIAFFAVSFGRRLGLEQRVAIQDVLNLAVASDMRKLVRYIVIGTFLFEALGAVSLYYVFSSQTGEPQANNLFSAIFHSVSAFCNAGFSIHDGNLVQYARSPLLMLTLIVLIVAGGVGFYVLMDLGDLLTVRPRRPGRKIRLQTRLVLLMTAGLLLAGTCLFWVLEAGRLTPYPLWNQALIALFHSASSRTAGFNTVDVTLWAAPTYFFMALLMFVGASPGGTGGGVKTSTVGVVGGLVHATLVGRRQVEIFRRTISLRAVRLSVSIIMLSFLFVSISTFLLSLTEDAEFVSILFEAVSAFATVGLSAGLTPSLSTPGKLVVCVTMLAGRIGPLTLAFALSAKADRVHYEYPEEDIMVG